MRTPTILCCLLLTCASASAAVPQSQRDALVALYDSTKGPSWTLHDGWRGAPGTECQWSGIACDPNGDNVTQLYLQENNLAGPIPASIGDLTGLQILVLYGNPLTGTIPPELGRLSKLEALYLNKTALTGTIPQALGAMSKLAVLSISGTEIGGTIPPELGNLSSLEELYLSSNRFSGGIPSQLGQLTKLTKLDLSYNKLTGSIPRDLGNLLNLQYLQLTANELSGPIPPELGKLAALKELHLDINKLSGSIPPELGSLRALQRLVLANNNLTGTLPATTGDLRALQFLNVSVNQLEGQIPPELLRLGNLEELYLNSNKFSGEIPHAVGSLTSLKTLSLSSNRFSGAIPIELTTLTKLRSLEVLSNQLTGSIPGDISNLTLLESLDLGDNLLTGPIPPSVGKLINLTTFSVYTNRLSGPIPGEIGNLTKLQYLYLGGNQLSGAIPDSLRNLRELIQLTAAGNALTGSIPSWIGELTKLTQIDFSSTQLSGSIPPGITSLASLELLLFSDCRLTGSLPRDIGNLRELTVLTFAANQLEGTIPPSIGQLTKLEILGLDTNNFSGTLPREIGNLSKLFSLSLYDNDLEGLLPPELGNLTSLQYFSVAVNRFNGPIPKEIGRLTKLLRLDLSSNAFRGPVPAEIKLLTLLADDFSDFNYNALQTSDPAIRDLLNRKSPGWEKTQTITPLNPRLLATTDRSATIEWDLISYQDDEGGYQVVASLTQGGAPVAIGTTGSKEMNSVIVRGLSPVTSYFFTLTAVTHPHYSQHSLLVSDPTPSFTATTGPRVVAPADVVLVEPAGGLVQVDGVPKNEDTFTLTNYGDLVTTLNVTKGDGDFYTITPETFTLPGGASQIVTIRSLSKPAGTYYGYIVVKGDGTGDGIVIGLALLSSVRPAGTVIAEAVTTRIELAGAPGSDSVGAARFRNRGTALLTGILISDQPWVQPATDPITIAPGETEAANFRVVRSKRPEGLGALSANLSLVYVDGSIASSFSSAASFADHLMGALDTPASGVSVSRVTIVDVSKPPVTPGTAPPLVPGEVALFAPGIATFLRGGMSVTSDVSIVNASGARALTDLRLFFTPAGSSNASVATMQPIVTSQAVSLVNVVGNVYNANDSVGTLQLRSTDWRNVGAFAKLRSTSAASTAIGEMPIFRSDRSAATNQATNLTGVRGGADLFIQETSGTATTARIDYLDANGSAIGAPRTEALPSFALIELRGAIPAGTITAIVTNSGAGRLAAYARVTDAASGDTWSVVDWSRANHYSISQPIRIPFAEGRTAGGGGRRRAAPHAQSTSSSTDITLFNPASGEARAKLQVIDAAGKITERSVTVPSRRTITFTDAASPSTTAHIVVEPTHGQLVVTARDYRTSPAGTYGSAIPVVDAASGLRLGQSQIFADLEDSTSATIATAAPSTFRTGYGFVETAGASTTVRARIVVTQSALTTATLSRTFVLAPRQQLVLDDLVRSFNASRDTAYTNLHGLKLQIEVVDGKGSIVPFVIITDNGSGDSIVRIE